MQIDHAPAANTDPPDTHCSICRAPLRPEGWRRRWATCAGRTGCGLLSTHYGTDRRPTRLAVAAMWVRWVAYRVVTLVLGNEWHHRT